MPDIQQYSVSIKIKTEGSEKASKDMEKVKGSLDKLKGSTSGFSKISAGFSNIGKGIAKFSKTMTVAAVAAGAAMVKAGKSAYNLTKQMNDYIETTNLFAASMGSLAEEALKFRNRAENELGLDPENIMNAIASFQNLSEGFGIASDEAYFMSKNLTQLSGDLSSFANISFEAAQKKIMSGFSGQVLPLRKYGIALDQVSLQELAYSLGIEQRVKTMTRAQKSELIYYQIMKSTQKMQGDLGRTIMSPANALRVLQTEFKQLARAIGSIFIPMMMSIVPVMRMVVKALTSAAEAIAKFFGFEISDYEADLSEVGTLLDGVAEDIDDVGDSAGSTTDKLNKMLMPFDELNNITTSSKSSGSGSGVSGVGGGTLGIDLPGYDMFEFIDERFNEMIANGNWRELARTMATKLNETLKAIPWDEIKKTSGEIGKNIAEFLNIGIRTINWRLYGKTFAEGINTIIEFAYNFVTTFDWVEFGKAISDTVEGFFDNVEWDKIGATLSEGITGALETSTTAIENFDVSKITEAFVQLVSNVNWLKVGFVVGKHLLQGLLKSPIFYFPYLLQKAIDFVISKIIDGINSIKIKVPDWIPGIGGKEWSPDINFKGASEQYDEFMQSIAETTYDSILGMDESWEKYGENVGNTLEKTEEKATESGANVGINYNKSLEQQEPNTIKIIESITSIISNLDQSKEANDYGTNTLNSYADSITGMSNSVQIVVDKVKSIFPGLDQSQQTNNYGKNDVAGFNSGANSQTGNVEKTFGNIISTIKSKLNDPETLKRIGVTDITGFDNGAASQNGAVQNTFSNIISLVKGKLNDPEAMKRIGENDANNFAQGANSQNTNVTSVFGMLKNRVESILKSNDSYTWGQDFVTGYVNGIKSKKSILALSVSNLAQTISSWLHFSKPDVGPLREYEKWMPDMIKGLSDSLLKSIPQLNSTLMQVATTISDSITNIEMPDVEQSIFTGQSSAIIGQIGNKANYANNQTGTTNIAEATYNAVSRALADNNSTNDGKIIQVNIGNREVYRGYGQFKDEQSRMLGVNV